MTDMAVEHTAGQPLDPGKVQQDIADKITQAEQYRRQFEAGWLTNLAFVAGQHWLVTDLDDPSRTLRHISEVDDRYADRELYTADVITEQRAAALGELQTDDDRPQLLIPSDGESSEADEEIEEFVNKAVGHGWDYEWQGDQTLMDTRRKCLDLGVSAIRARWNPMAGPPIMDEQSGQQVQVPIHHETGQPLTDANKAYQYVSDAYQSGQPVKFRDQHEGRHEWQTGSAFNLLTPPGVPHERDFPWEIWVRPAPLESVKTEYGAAADSLTADEDITSVLGLGMKQTPTTANTAQQGSPAKLKDHVWLYTYYEKPTRAYPQGRTVVLAGGNKKLLQQTPSLPYQDTDKTWCSGIVYFHWWRLDDRFYSKSFVEGLKDPQRMINRRKTQAAEIIDRGMPFILAEEDSVPQGRQGVPVEWVKVKKGTTVQPQVQGGIGPGEWMYRDVQELREDLAHASTLSALQMGENPDNVLTYSQLALLSEKEGGKRATIRVEHRDRIAQLVKYAVYDIAKFWPDEKKIMVAGEGDRIAAETFKKSTIPPLYVVRVAKGSAKPKTQAAQLQLISDIWAASVNAGAATANPDRWIHWYHESLAAGEPLDLPEIPTDEQADKANLENHMLLNGDQPPVAYYDRPDIHIPQHRLAQDEAQMAGDQETWGRIEQHVQLHLHVAAANAQQLAASQPEQPQLPAGTDGTQPAAPAAPAASSPAPPQS